MKKIKLYNRDGADLWLKKCNKQIEPNVWMWYLDVDKKHEYILKYCRYIGDNLLEPEAIDPSGGPMLSVGDEFEFLSLNEEEVVVKMLGKIVKINSAKNIWISERDNNN
jgi:hypothetical protein